MIGVMRNKIRIPVGTLMDMLTRKNTIIYNKCIALYTSIQLYLYDMIL